MMLGTTNIKLKEKYILAASTLCLIPYLKDIPHVKNLPPSLKSLYACAI